MAGGSVFKKRLKKAPGKAATHSQARSLHTGTDTSYIRRSDGGLEVRERVVEYASSARPAKRARVVSPEASPEPSVEAGAGAASSSRTPTTVDDDQSAWEDVEIGDCPPNLGDEENQCGSQRKKDAKEKEKGTKPAREKISDKMKKWEARFPSILQDMLSWEVPEVALDVPASPTQTVTTAEPSPITTAHATARDTSAERSSTPNSPWKCACGDPALYRCVECNASAPSCKSCFCRAHKHAWFHYVEAWTGLYFKRYDLYSLGFIIYLGHQGCRCPHLSQQTQPSIFVIAHSNGVHDCKLQYCHCPDAPDEVSQLLRARLWLNTLETPRCAFTVSLLQTWHQLWLNAKISTLHFMRALARYTNNAFPADVQDRTRDFRLVSRLYAHLTMVKRAGKALGIIIPNQDPNSIVIPCILCPSPGFNLRDDWKEKTPKEVEYINYPVHGGDGNHSLNKRMKNDDKSDVPMSRGKGFWNAHHLLSTMIKQSYAGDVGKQDETCSGFKVGRSQRSGKFRFVEISGIVAVTCRHVFFKNGAVVDLITGERYHFMDFAHAAALRGTEKLPRRRWSYDVVCIYIKGMLARWKEFFPEMVSLIEDMECCLPAFHAHAHRDVCQAVYAMGYAEGWGLLKLETVEHPWAEFNPAGLVTRQMTTGAREDSLNDLFNFWNRMKTERVVEALPKELEKAYEIQAATTKQFANLVALAGAKQSLEWASMDIHTTAPTPSNWAEKEAAYESNIYVLHRADIPTREKALNELVAMFETADKASLESVVSHMRKGGAHFIKRGVELHLQQFVIRNRVKLARANDVAKKDVYPTPLRDVQRAFRTSFVAWRAEQRRFMPLLPLPEELPALDNDDDDDDEPADDRELLYGTYNV